MTTKEPKKKTDTRKKVSVYFQIENAQSEAVYKRLDNIAKVTGMSLSAVTGMAVRLAITQLEEALIEPAQLLPADRKSRKVVR